jgi:hypothetical protein
VLTGNVGQGMPISAVRNTHRDRLSWWEAAIRFPAIDRPRCASSGPPLPTNLDGQGSSGLSVEPLKQRFRLFQIRCVETFGEPAVDRRRFVARRPPRTNGVRLTRSKVLSEEPNRRAIREARSRVVVKLDVLARELGCRYGARFLRQRAADRRRRVGPWEKRARFGNAIPNVVNTQEGIVRLTSVALGGIGDHAAATAFLH